MPEEGLTSREMLAIVGPVTALALVAQYLLGLWTNLYGPASGFTTSTEFGPLSAHYDVGYLIGVLALLMLLLAFLSRETRLITLAVLLLVAVAVAGIAGMAFVHTQPNPPIDSFVMGTAFLGALAANLVLNLLVRRPARPLPVGSTVVAV